jgi:hypothetical protein
MTNQVWALAAGFIVVLAISARIFWRRGKGPWDAS